MVLIDDIRQKAYTFDEVKVWEQYLDNHIDEEAQNGMSKVVILKTPGFEDFSNLNEYHLRILDTVMSMYRNEGFKVKLKYKKERNSKKKKPIALKISW